MGQMEMPKGGSVILMEMQHLSQEIMVTLFWDHVNYWNLCFIAHPLPACCIYMA